MLTVRRRELEIVHQFFLGVVPRLTHVLFDTEPAAAKILWGRLQPAYRLQSVHRPVGTPAEGRLSLHDRISAQAMKGITKISAMAFTLLCATGLSSAGNAQGLIVRLAELEIDATQLENYKAALKEEIETSIRIEPGVLSLSAVAVKDNPAQIRILEVYANETAYRSHLETLHFKKYKALTLNMVKSLKMI
jgi:quinol monooxygenase YgiN